MGVTCSLLGHAFEEADTERERTEQGSEAITVVREIEECRRCGERRVTSESKEVTSIVEPSDVAVDDATDPEPESAAETDAESEPEPAVAAATAGGEPGPGGDEPPLESDPAVDPGFTSGEDDEEPPADPSEEDAEILDDEPTETPKSAMREPGQWPDESDQFDPSTLTGDEGVEASASTESSDESPQSESTEGAEATTEPAATSILDGEYVCPECGFTEQMDASSLREGDACPACHRGYLDAR
ncbi:hypothetical protein DM867_02050 [Halosegnis rubeus]|jgi:ssDNA-binding Zn-finger/Zn-ribbon topoisomerase 1|uniref:Uncharacterized protein n=1 Tax=Halosegnis rubeus TaxID=2212850 RepID=A0A5N5UBP4_9EURY|nr:hypothetical protein [Halosegnis rubeus]KAB7515947.1 hypothetical protein DM867_02050 [Halosegnis rubeus]KAB7516840.1 hypothetical protein DMP03_05600 [Halosegnis rubeus]KAB7520033.1 hypothetical protein DP108_01935 [Halosegnis rubeus]